MKPPPAVKRLALMLCFASSLACAQSDRDFLAAKTAFDRGDSRSLDALAPLLKGHVLEAYVEYWRLKLALSTVAPEEVRAYFTRYSGTPPAHQLRIDWLKSLASRGQWDLFGEDYVALPGEDSELACHAVAHRRQREGDAALVGATRLWFTGRTTPDACTPLFDALIASGVLDRNAQRARFRLAVEAGNTRLARSIGAQLAPPAHIPESSFVRIDRNPLAALNRGEFAWHQASGRDLALYALERAARRDAAVAHGAWVKWRARLPGDDRLYGNARLAYHAARQHVPEAHVYYREAAGSKLSEEQRAWEVRAALRARSWTDVRGAIEAMPPEQRDEPAWRYWRARALENLGAAREAAALYAELTSRFDFYGLLAREKIGVAVTPVSRPLVPPDEVLAGFAARADVQRAVKLGQLDLRVESIAEWYPVVRGLNDEGLLVASEFARRAGLIERAINTAELTTDRHDFALRYQMPFRAEFEAAAREQDLDSALLFAIARQESRFTPEIVSSAGARGLMQLMPGTARWVAKQLGEAAYRPAHIVDVETNTRFGAYYFRYWLDRLDSHAAMAAAAYNAGPGRAQAWRPVEPLEGAIWIETIPFNETRDYVKKVLANVHFYSDLLNRPRQPFSTRVGTITPRPSSGGAVASAN